MKNYLKGFSDFYKLNEMASTLSKLGVPKKLIKVIHNLPDKVEKITPFDFKGGGRRSYELPPIGQNRPSHEVEVTDHFRMKKTELLGDNYGIHKSPGFLADLEKVPWGDTRILLAVPEPGGKYADTEPRYDYIYHKGSAWGKVSQGGGKKYRVLTIDGEGKILRDWQAYQGKLTYPKDPNNPQAERKFRNDFKDFPTAADGKIDVYILDTEIVDTERVTQQLGLKEIPPGDTYNKPVHDVGIGKARMTARERMKSRLMNSDVFIDSFASRFKEIIATIFGKRKQQAAAAYADLILQDNADGQMINDLQKTININPDVMENIENYYKGFIKAAKALGDYRKTELAELGDTLNLGSTNMKNYASIIDMIDKHGKDKVSRMFAEFILTGEISGLNKDDEYDEELETSTETDDFEDMLDFDFDLENPFDTPPDA
jgi:hypothetical protein